jgi:superfamily II DNA or RNA helicase
MSKIKKESYLFDYDDEENSNTPDPVFKAPDSQPSIALRDYQSDAREAVIDAWRKEKVTRPLVQLPTGTGKTVVFASLARELQAKTLIIAHRDELLRQAQDKVNMVWPEAKTGIVKASENDFKGKNVVIASIQTLSREKRLKQVAGQDFDLCIIDEAHHSCSRTYRDTISYLGFMDDDPKRLLLGVTATTKRLDKMGLRNVFQKIVYESSLRTMVKAGYLSDIRGFRTNTGVDLTTVKTSKGDFVEVELSVLVNTPERNERVVESYVEHAIGRKALCFTAGVQHAHDLSHVFNTHGIAAMAISGKTSDNERKEILRAFSAGEIQVLCNCNLLTEGYDEPSIDCILLARPTKSATLYTQMVGRGTRKYPGKSDCVVIDFTDRGHDICALPSLLGLSVDEMTKGESLLEEMEKEEQAERGSNAVRKDIGNLEEFDLLGKSVFRWIQAQSEWRLPIEPGLWGVLVPDGSEGKYKTILYRKDEQPRLFYPTALNLGYAQGMIEDYARRFGKVFARKDAPWREAPATDKQVDLLRRLGINPQGMTKGAAADAIDGFFATQSARKGGQWQNVGVN